MAPLVERLACKPRDRPDAARGPVVAMIPVMKPLCAALVAASGLLVVASAAAQEAAPPIVVTAVPGPLPPGVSVTMPSCRLSDHTGVDDADAATAGRLVCAEIAHAGDLSGARYRVSLGTLGSLVILSVAREGDAPGSTVDSREMTLHGIEEVALAAPRIASSIVQGTPLPDTQTVVNLVGQEPREPKTKPGKLHFALGLNGTFAPFDQGFSVAPGGLLDLHYEMSQFEFGGSLRFGGGSSSNTAPTVSFFEASLGGRYFSSDKDVSPYIGGGLSWSFFNLDSPSSGFDGNNSGLGAYIDGGIELMRTHHAHLAMGVRVDVPFFALNNNNDYTGGFANGTTAAAQAPAAPQTIYYVPVSLEARLTF